jgi:hypothetical protein
MEIWEKNRIEKDYRMNAKPGDIFFKKVWHDRDSTEVKVERVTKTQIVLEDGKRVNKEFGTVVGAAEWDRVSYFPACDHVREDFEAENRRRAARKAMKDAHEALVARINARVGKSMTVEEVEALTAELNAILPA